MSDSILKDTGANKLLIRKFGSGKGRGKSENLHTSEDGGVYFPRFVASRSGILALVWAQGGSKTQDIWVMEYR